MEQKVHKVADLESFYDRQLANVCGVAEEAVGADRMEIKLLKKVTTRFEHWTHTNFGIRKNHAGVDMILWED